MAKKSNMASRQQKTIPSSLFFAFRLPHSVFFFVRHKRVWLPNAHNVRYESEVSGFVIACFTFAIVKTSNKIISSVF
jgi:hypothetical protein